MSNNHTLDEIFRKLIPNFDEWKLQMTELKRVQGEQDRIKFLILLDNYTKDNPNKLGQVDILFLLQQAQMIHYDFCEETISHFSNGPVSSNFDALKSILLLKKDVYEERIKKMNPNLKQFLLMQLSFLYSQLETSYGNGLKKWVFSNKEYTVKNLLDDIDEFKFTRLLKEMNPDLFNDNLKMYTHLRAMQPNKTENPTYIQLNHYTEEGINGYDISGFIEGDLKSFSLEFEPWENWLSFYIASDTLNNHCKEEVLYHCLSEMTLISFNEDEIRAEQEQLDNIMDGIEECEEDNE